MRRERTNGRRTLCKFRDGSLCHHVNDRSPGASMRSKSMVAIVDPQCLILRVSRFRAGCRSGRGELQCRKILDMSASSTRSKSGHSTNILTMKEEGSSLITISSMIMDFKLEPKLPNSRGKNKREWKDFTSGRCPILESEIAGVDVDVGSKWSMESVWA